MVECSRLEDPQPDKQHGHNIGHDLTLAQRLPD
jgi:hypothetical protein